MTTKKKTVKSKTIELTEAQLLEMGGTSAADMDKLFKAWGITDFGACSGSTLARMARVCSGSTLDRMAGVCSGSTLDRMKALREGIPVLKTPYTAIKKAIGSQGCSLKMDHWHTCKTTHCLAGWTTTLAGVAGKDFEKKWTVAGAAALILRKSRPEAPMPNFFASDAEAMAFINARAAEEV